MSQSQAITSNNVPHTNTIYVLVTKLTSCCFGQSEISEGLRRPKAVQTGSSRECAGTSIYRFGITAHVFPTQFKEPVVLHLPAHPWKQLLFSRSCVMGTYCVPGTALSALLMSPHCAQQPTDRTLGLSGHSHSSGRLIPPCLTL